MRLIFTRGDGLANRLIRAFEGGDWDHVGIIDGDHVIEATASHGVRRRLLASLQADRPVHEIVNVPGIPGQEGMALQWARKQVGKPYDWGGVVGFLFWRGSWAATGSWYCSELGALTLALSGRQVAGQHRRVGVRMLYALAHAWACAAG